MMRALQWRIVLGLVLVFLAGGATGYFGGSWQAHRTFGERHGRMSGERMQERLKRKLELTPEQAQVVDPILRQTSERLQVIRAETGQRVSETMQQAQREMAPHLTPAQIEKLERMKKRHERKHRRHLERRRAREPEIH